MDRHPCSPATGWPRTSRDTPGRAQVAHHNYLLTPHEQGYSGAPLPRLSNDANPARAGILPTTGGLAVPPQG